MNVNIYLLTALVLLAAALGMLIYLIKKYREKVFLERIENDISGESGEKQDDKPFDNKIFGKIDVFVEEKQVSSHIIYSGETTVGRDPNRAGIVIPELIVSKHHCTLFTSGDRLFVRDEESTNGIYFEGKRVSQLEINDGMVVLLGRRGIVKLNFHGMENLRNEPVF